MSAGAMIVGETPLHLSEKEVSGEYTTLGGEDFFVIKHFDQMPPFFMTVVSASNHWLFISSNGALSAGRNNPDNALFPYYTDDKITDSVGTTGPVTIFRVKTPKGDRLWEPFAEHFQGIYETTSNLYKNREGNRIVFEEINHDLGLTYRYGWMFSDKYGIVKRSTLIHHGDKPVTVELIDGVQNIIPYGVDSNLQNMRSTLVDAYKRCELDEATGLGIYSLSSMVIDTAEPSEALKATTVWASGINYDSVLLSTGQLRNFRQGRPIDQETDIKAEKGAFFIHGSGKLNPGEERDWLFVHEVGQSVVDIKALQRGLENRDRLHQKVLDDIAQDKKDLRKKIGLTDGIQLSNDRRSTGRHFSNVLFNIMRGGTFDDQYEINIQDFVRHVRGMNREEYDKLQPVLQGLPSSISYHQLRQFLFASRHSEVMRYYLEYLPLSFSRRHGDPSRPWNYFSIETNEDANGNKQSNFEGNWRDIFQNWEALAFSYPEFTLAMIAKFVNASTIDGYNPYRITSEGIDWEVVEPNDPWSYIGYWGDHQIIYLTKLLELSQAVHPHRLKELLTMPLFTYANVPYRIKGYDAIASDPKDTIDFDHDLEAEIARRVERVGSDGKMVWDRNGDLEVVNLTEKILVPVLTKLYNFIPEAGIWLNTQRPEWNDANNALVGNGVSMVTLYYLRRFLEFAQEMFGEIATETLTINKPVVDLMEALERGFRLYQPSLNGTFSDKDRRQFMDGFGVAGEHYRTTAYAGFTGDKRTLRISEMLDFFSLAQKYMEHAIDLNQRKDGLYHSYNLITLSDGRAEVGHLYEMLEGQVAVLSAKYLDSKKTAQVLNALKSSSMFREDQYSYMLYPDRQLPAFLEKNAIPAKALKRSRLLEALLAAGDRSVVERDIHGTLHFNGDFHNAKDLDKALNGFIDPDLAALAQKERPEFLAAFEQVFDHRSFTGRSGTFYGYEGLGSIYWHMVSKLLLAIQENIYLARDANASAAVMGNLIEHYYEIRAGIGANKSPALYGAFPTDAYSHTPKYAGAQQPGMTGQVKEDIINRWAELGIRFDKGCVSFEPVILRQFEFLKEAATLSYYDHEGEAQKIDVPAGGMAFTYCQIPVVYRLGKKRQMTVRYMDGTETKSTKAVLNVDDSKSVFKRLGKVKSIEVMGINVLPATD